MKIGSQCPSRKERRGWPLGLFGAKFRLCVSLTHWKCCCMESAANQSPAPFPIYQGWYREFSVLCSRLTKIEINQSSHVLKAKEVRLFWRSEMVSAVQSVASAICLVRENGDWAKTFFFSANGLLFRSELLLTFIRAMFPSRFEYNRTTSSLNWGQFPWGFFGNIPVETAMAPKPRVLLLT